MKLRVFRAALEILPLHNRQQKARIRPRPTN